MAKRLKNDLAYRVRLDAKVSAELIRGVLEGAVAHGQIDPRGKSSEAVAKEFAELILRTLDGGRFLFTIDHTGSLRDLGRKFERNERPWLATLFYATWVEHVLNGLIALAVSRRGDTDAVTKQIIRDVPLQGKLTWLLPLLGYRPLGQAHVGHLQKLADFRNQFVHYKWSYVDINESGSATLKLLDFLTHCRGSLQHLARYSTSAALAGSKAKLHRAVAR
jgi:hypothetical protein